MRISYCLIILFFSLSISCQVQDLADFYVEQITFEDGISLGYTRDIFQDSTGLIWISSTNGILNYDGKKILKFAKDDIYPFDKSVQFFIRTNGNIRISDWNMPSKKIYEYNPYSREIVDSVEQDLKSPKRIYDHILVGDITWAITDPFEDGKHLYLLRETVPNKLSIIDTIPLTNFSHIISVDNRVFVSGKEGIYSYNHSGKFDQLYPLKENGLDVSIFDMSYDASSHTIYTKSDHEEQSLKRSSAVFSLDLKTNKVSTLAIDPTITSNSAYVKIIDQYLWIAGLELNVRRINLKTGKVIDFTTTLQSISNKSPYIRGVFKDALGRFWITSSNGLYRISEKKPIYHKFYSNSEEPTHGLRLIQGISDHPDGLLYAELDKLYQYNNKLQIFDELPYVPNLSKKEGANLLWDIDGNRFHGLGNKFLWNDLLIDSETSETIDLLDEFDFRVTGNFIDDTTIWIAPFWPKNNMDWLYQYDINKSELTPIVNALSDTLGGLLCIEKDPYRDVVWIGTRTKGLLSFSQDGKLISIPFEQHKTLRNAIFYNIIFDEKGDLWLASSQGLVSYNPISKKQEIFPIHLPHQSIHLNNTSCYSLVQYNNHIWLGTMQGLHRFNTDSRQYDTPELPLEIRETEVSYTSACKDDNGMLYFGTTRGLLGLEPKKISYSLTHNYPILLTSFKIFDKKLNKEQAFFSNLGNLDHIELTAKDLWFSMNYTLIDRENALYYSHMLEGFDAQWSEASTVGELKYTNLPAGEYQLRLKVGLSKGFIDSEERTITLRVYPVWYKSWWFILFVIFALALLGWVIVRNYLRVERNKLILKQQAEEAKNLKELDQLKSQFYTNITHEFRTPLTVILGMVDNIKGHAKEKRLIQRNGKNLLRLVTQLLDLAKINASIDRPIFVQGDIIHYLEYLSESFYSLAKEKDVRLVFYAEDDSILCGYDENKLQHIVYNLLNNAIKFTPAGGKVVMHVKYVKVEEKPIVQLVIKDTGIGIPQENIPYLFDQFYQVDSNSTRKYEGSGVGLTYVKKLIDQLQGSIEIDSTEGKGTSVIVKLPMVRNDKWEQSTFLAEATKNTEESIVTPYSGIADSQEIELVDDKTCVLIVEDNADVRFYIRSIIEYKHQILEADNGKIGLELALKYVPDIIITDLMMPEMDGMELCKMLKSDGKTDHIPIIMLTAKSTDESRIMGFKQGADAYLVKPFNKEELEIRIDQMLQLRANVVANYNAKGNDDHSTIEKNPLIEKMRLYILENISKTDLRPADLEEAFIMSKMQVYRKLKSLTNRSPSNYIRSIRLEKAKELMMAKQELNLNEIAYQVGFSDPNYFSRVFHDEYGRSPSQYKAENSESI